MLYTCKKLHIRLNSNHLLALLHPHSVRLLQFSQLKHAPKYGILYKIYISRVLQFATSDPHTQMVRQANMSSKRTMPVALPYQNQADGNDWRLWPTTFDA